MSIWYSSSHCRHAANPTMSDISRPTRSSSVLPLRRRFVSMRSVTTFRMRELPTTLAVVWGLDMSHLECATSSTRILSMLSSCSSRLSVRLQGCENSAKWLVPSSPSNSSRAREELAVVLVDSAFEEITAKLRSCEGIICAKETSQCCLNSSSSDWSFPRGECCAAIVIATHGISIDSKSYPGCQQVRGDEDYI